MALHSFYIQLLLINLILVLIGKWIKSQVFSPDWPELGLIRAEKSQNMGKIWFFKSR